MRMYYKIGTVLSVGAVICFIVGFSLIASQPGPTLEDPYAYDSGSIDQMIIFIISGSFLIIVAGALFSAGMNQARREHQEQMNRDLIDAIKGKK